MKFQLDLSYAQKYSIFMVNEKKKMGRPPKKASERRSRPVTLRMTPAEHEQLIRDAGASGLCVSGYLQKCWGKVRMEHGGHKKQSE